MISPHLFLSADEKNVALKDSDHSLFWAEGGFELRSESSACVQGFAFLNSLSEFTLSSN